MPSVQYVNSTGATAYVVTTQSFPTGFSVTKFADDSDPWSFENVEPVAFEPLATGGIYTYMKAAPVKVSLSVIPGTDDDRNLRYMMLQRLSQSQVVPLPDLTTLALTYPDGSVATFQDGSILSGPPAASATGAGRLKANTYTFVFGKMQVIDLGSFAGIVGTISQFF